MAKKFRVPTVCCYRATCDEKITFEYISSIWNKLLFKHQAYLSTILIQTSFNWCDSDNLRMVVNSVTRKKSPNVYKTCPKINDFSRKMIDFDTFTKIA